MSFNLKAWSVVSQGVEAEGDKQALLQDAIVREVPG